MSAQVLFVSAQTEGRRKAVWSGQAYIYPLNYLLNVGVNVSYYQIVHHPIHILPVGIANIMSIFKTNQ